MYSNYQLNTLDTVYFQHVNILYIKSWGKYLYFYEGTFPLCWQLSFAPASRQVLD